MKLLALLLLTALVVACDANSKTPAPYQVVGYSYAGAYTVTVLRDTATGCEYLVVENGATNGSLAITPRERRHTRCN